MKNKIIEKDNYAIMIIEKKNHGTFNVLIDKEDIEKINICKWYVDYSPKFNNRYVVRNTKYGFLHRFILDLKSYSGNDMIDHIDRNTLNNRKSNLRIVTNSINQKNRGLQSNNTSGISGVRYNDKIKSWVCRYTDNEKKRHTRTFSVNKYGFNEAKELAIKLRKEKEKEFNYL